MPRQVRDPQRDRDAPGLPAAIEAAWGADRRPRKGRRPGLTLEGIVDAAVHVASGEGLGAVSMSRVASELGASTMSLYRYVAAKDELLTLMVDAAIATPPAPVGAGEDWRAGLTRWAWGLHDAYRRHPWSLEIPIAGPPMTPNQMLWFEDAAGALAGTGLPEVQKASVVLLLSGFVRNEAQLMTGMLAAMEAAGGDVQQAMTAWTRTLRRLADPARYPAVHAMLDAGVFDTADDPDDEFVFGLTRILDGVEALIGVDHR